MFYEGDIFRPPAEHASILMQITVGCSHNKCGFCGLYKYKKFRIKSDQEIGRDIEFASRMFKAHKRIFLCDGDAMIIPFDRLISILRKINEKIPWITRIGLYANAKSLKTKTLDELKELKKHKLGIVYLGLESGDDDVLKNMVKGVTVTDQIEQGKKVKESGMKLSCTVLLGLGGKERSREHAVNTGKALTKINPNYASALSLILVRDTSLYKMIEKNEFHTLSPKEVLEELKILIENTELSSGIFSANHASNYLPLQFRMPGGKEEALSLIDKALAGNIPIKPEYLRAI